VPQSGDKRSGNADLLGQRKTEQWVLCFAVCRSLSTVWIDRSIERLTGRLLRLTAHQGDSTSPLLLGILYTRRHACAVRQNVCFITSRQSRSKQGGQEAKHVNVNRLSIERFQARNFADTMSHAAQLACQGMLQAKFVCSSLPL